MLPKSWIERLVVANGNLRFLSNPLQRNQDSIGQGFGIRVILHVSRSDIDHADSQLGMLESGNGRVVPSFFSVFWGRSLSCWA